MTTPPSTSRRWAQTSIVWPESALPDLANIYAEYIGGDLVRCAMPPGPAC